MRKKLDRGINQDAWKEILALRRRLQEVIAGTVGTPAAHATTHEDGGSDPIAVTDLDGFPGGTTDFLRADGTFATPSGGTETKSIVLSLDGGGADITTGVKKWIRIPVACTITGWTLLANAAGSIVIDIWKDSFANYPPTDADSITGGNEPELSTDDEAEDNTLTGWTGTAIAAGQVLAFNVDSCSGISSAVMQITVTVP